MPTRQSTVTVQEFVSHLQFATVATIRCGPVEYDAKRRLHWGYVGLEISTGWLDAIHCWICEHPKGAHCADVWILEDDREAWTIHSRVHVVDSDGVELDKEAMRDLLVTYTPLADVSRLDMSVLAADKLQSE
jgi:hypothetical protein